MKDIHVQPFSEYMYNIQLFYVALGKVSKINQWLVISPAAQPRHDSLSIFPSEIITLRWIGIAAIFGVTHILAVLAQMVSREMAPSQFRCTFCTKDGREG